MRLNIYIHQYVADDLSSRIAGARALYERAGTQGERQAALEALRRMGVDPDASTRPGASQKKQRFDVTIMNGNSVITTYRGVEASSRGEAESQSIRRAESLWSRTSRSGGPPRFTASSTPR